VKRVVLPPIGIVTEGQGEVSGLPEIYNQLQESCGCRLIKPIFASVHPKAPIAILCKDLAPRVKLSIQRGARIVVILLDLEDADECPGVRAKEVENGLRREVSHDVRVVMKDSCFENWLIADPAALRRLPALFGVRDLRFTPGRADKADALTLLKRASGSAYAKTVHPQQILARADVNTMASNSRSFNKFKRVLAASE
jgi:hypothetical protein